MAYFSNGSEGTQYEHDFCSRCVHYDGCPVWGLHLLWNYEQDGNPDKEEALSMLIPRSQDELDNEECKMFYEKPR